MLTHTVTVMSSNAGAADEFGNVSETFTVTATERGRFEQRSAEERSVDRTTVISDWVLYLHPNTKVTATSRVSDEYGRIFEVVGPPAMLSTPTRNKMVEASLRFVEGL